jgi:hypothetical protein
VGCDVQVVMFVELKDKVQLKCYLTSFGIASPSSRIIAASRTDDQIHSRHQKGKFPSNLSRFLLSSLHLSTLIASILLHGAYRIKENTIC